MQERIRQFRRSKRSHRKDGNLQQISFSADELAPSCAKWKKKEKRNERRKNEKRKKKRKEERQKGKREWRIYDKEEAPPPALRIVFVQEELAK